MGLLQQGGQMYPWARWYSLDFRRLVIIEMPTDGNHNEDRYGLETMLILA